MLRYTYVVDSVYSSLCVNRIYFLLSQSASLSEHTTKILDGGATTADLSEIEQIVKERMVSPFSQIIHTDLCIAQSTTCIINRSNIQRIRKGIVSCEPLTGNR
jgi:hypothetical protein